MVFRTAVISVWLLVVGLLSVSLECKRIRVGHRIHDLFRQEEEMVERIRRLEIRYNSLVSPDRLERRLPESFLADGRASGGGQVIP